MVLFIWSMPGSFEICLGDLRQHFCAGRTIVPGIAHLRNVDGVNGGVLNQDLHHADSSAGPDSAWTPGSVAQQASGKAAGLGGVWAAKTFARESGTPKRKEVYATTGDRPVVRVFAGWDFVLADRDRTDFAANGYAHGVPTGGDLNSAPAGKVPTVLVRAVRNPEGPISTAPRSGSIRVPCNIARVLVTCV
jgi:Protein of unknown function (DUF3604)